MSLPKVAGSERIDWAEGQRVIDCAIDHGINYFDSAFLYHNGDSEVF